MNRTFRSYVIGFILSIILTIIPYFLVVNHLLRGEVLVAALLGFAMLQLLVQLLFFLHMGQESKPRWNLIVFICFISIILIIVIGSLVIMHNLNYNMNSSDMSNYLLEEEGIHK
ncbi:MAG TPA: cytochrome o ubiquinol oxidase subunit IV [Methylomirabilota bacterium]|nr:cytochrome o ubiquinol oxidase subunit IV [Methylomirabilota bacterium]